MSVDPKQVRTYRIGECISFRKTNEPYGGLSNMAGGFPLRVNGVLIHSSEALYQACRFPHLPDVQLLILREKSPMTAKMVSKPHRHRSRQDWDRIRVRVMRWALRVKLAMHWDKFSQLLLSTESRAIVEDSRRDDFWGALHRGEDTLVGMNVLGRLLMELREELMASDRDRLRVVAPPDIPGFTLIGLPIREVGFVGKGVIREDPDLQKTNQKLWQRDFGGLPKKNTTEVDDSTATGDFPSDARPHDEHSSSDDKEGVAAVAVEQSGLRHPKRLIEVDLPIRRISAHARREKSIRHGHISTLHIWWARRPLAACRAVICAALWPDPVDPNCPERFRAVARKLMSGWAKDRLGLMSKDSYPRFVSIQKNPARLVDNIELRNALLDFIADFANWDNATVPEFLDVSRLLTQTAHEALGGTPGTRPLVLDPFAGGGSIPLEALRVGADAFATDLNPVPVLLNKFVIEDIPKYGERLADEVRRWGAWMRDAAEKQIGDLYPSGMTLGKSMAYLWARTVISEAPGSGKVPVEIPLLRTLWLSKRKDFLRALRWARNADGEVETEFASVQVGGVVVKVRRPVLEIFTPTRADKVEPGTVKGGSATCPLTGYTMPALRVREQLAKQRGGADFARLYAVYVERSGIREFRIAGKHDVKAFLLAQERARAVLANDAQAFPTEKVNPVRPYKNTRGLSAVTRIGCATFGDLYNQRQALSIHVLYGVLRQIPDATYASEPDFLRALKTALAFAINRGVSQNTSMSRWDASRLTIKGAFSKQALAVVWDFAEANPFSGGSADWDGAIDWVTKFIDANHGMNLPGTVVRASATSIPLPSDSASALVTDPPYFAAIPYADLSDFFYVWLKRGLGDIYPDLFGSDLTEKDEELIVTNAQCGRDGQSKDDSFFRKGMSAALESARDCVEPQGIGVVVYAEGTTAGWEAILGAIIDSKWIVTSSWPIDTEMENRTQAQGAAALQSSVHIVCRPRENSDGSVSIGTTGNWRDVLQELPCRIGEWLPRLAAEGVVGADAIFACLGPALEIFSRYSAVEKTSGERVELREYLEQVWAEVARQALNMIFEGADATGFEEDARLTAMWLWTLRTDTGADGGGTDDGGADEDEESTPKKGKASDGYHLEYDAARKIAQGLGCHLENLKYLVEVGGETATLLSVGARGRYLFGREDLDVPAKRGKKKGTEQGDLFARLALPTDSEIEREKAELERPSVGKTVLDQLHQTMILFGASRGQALKRFLVDDGVGGNAQFWKLAQALSALYPATSDEKRWVDGVLARKKGLGF